MADSEYSLDEAFSQSDVYSGVYQIRCLVHGKRYIGSAVDIRRRWIIHRHRLSINNHHCRPLQNAWNKHGADAFVFELIEEVVIPDLIRVEQSYLDRYGADGRNLYNTCPVAGSHLGRKNTPETIEKMRRVKIGKKHTPETRKKISEVQRGKVASLKSRQKTSVALKGRSKSPEHIEKVAAKRRGMKLSDEWRKNLSESHKGILQSPESIEKRRQSMLDKNSKATLDDVVEVRRLLAANVSGQEIAKRLGLSAATVSNIKLNRGRYANL